MNDKFNYAAEKCFTENCEHPKNKIQFNYNLYTSLIPRTTTFTIFQKRPTDHVDFRNERLFIYLNHFFLNLNKYQGLK